MLEILLNDRLDFTLRQADKFVQQAFHTTCRLYYHYRQLITSLLDRAPFAQDAGSIDYRDYRVFAEARFFLYTHR
jgi:hypothetical protein